MADEHVLKLTIPAEIEFSDLNLGRGPDGGITFDWTPIERICEASGLDDAIFRERHEDNVAGLIVTWYAEHRQRGGAADPIAEELIAEVRSEH